MGLAGRFPYALTLFVLLLACTGAQGRQPPRLEYLYMDANVGSSSGGHVALKLGDAIYHFQYFPDGLFRIVRDDWNHFRYLYNDLENRTIRSAGVEVTPAVYQQVRGRLNRLYLIQNAHLNVLAGLKTDVDLFESLQNGTDSLDLRGAGLFDSDRREDRHAQSLRALVHRRQGRGFLDDAIRRIEHRLRTYAPDPPDLTGVRVSRTRLPDLGRSVSQRYLELLLQREALTLLAQAGPLRADGIIDPIQCGGDACGGGLSNAERGSLRAYLDTLETAVLQLQDSVRPDKGFPMLLAMARYQVVQRSLESNRLLVLDPFSAQATTIPVATVQRKRALLQRLADRAQDDFVSTRRRVFARADLDEAAYNGLENSAARYYELRRGIARNRSIRVEQGRLIPALAKPVAAFRSAVPSTALETRRAVAERNYHYYRHALESRYAFRLLSGNCATELMRAVNGAFSGDTERVTAIGGRLRPGEALTFIPFRLFDEVQNRFRVTDVSRFPAYRKRRLADLYRTGDPAAVYLREFNTLTSTLYRNVDEDGAFLLFTDDVFWPRPIYGALNLAYGLVNAGAGIVTAPFEGDKRIRQGARGALFSLPELFFFNIRKGSFEFVEDTEVLSALPEPEVQEAAFNRRVAP